MEQGNQSNTVRAAFQWKISDKVRHERGKLWYLVMTGLGLALFVYAIFTANFLFALMIILVAFTVIVKDYIPVKELRIAITDRGIILGDTYTDYKDLKSFYIIYEPPQVKKLYFEFKGWRPDLSIDLMDIDPIAVREYLLLMLRENLEKEDETTMDVLERVMKL